MTIQKRLLQLEKRLMPAPETELIRQLMARLDVGTARARAAREALGLRLANDDEPVLSPIPTGTLRGLSCTQIQTRILHRGRERNHLRYLAARKEKKSA
jgi:hypothetical protein